MWCIILWCSRWNGFLSHTWTPAICHREMSLLSWYKEKVQLKGWCISAWHLHWENPIPCIVLLNFGCQQSWWKSVREGEKTWSSAGYSGSALKAFLNTTRLIYLGIYPPLLFALMGELQGYRTRSYQEAGRERCCMEQLRTRTHGLWCGL